MSMSSRLILVRLTVPLFVAVAVALASSPSDSTSGSLPRLFVDAKTCFPCHNGLVTPSGEDVSIGSDWEAAIMAHSSKDPYWQASVRREALEHPGASETIEDECSACHMPMARYRAHSLGRKGDVFAHLEDGARGAHAGRLAHEGVSCTMCHQIADEKLGTPESFTAGFVVDTNAPLGERALYGPFEVDEGRKTLMLSASRYLPEASSHVQRSELCATCHTLYTHTRGPSGEVIGELPEQMPYLEWRHSAYRSAMSCQSCHMPEVDTPMHLTGVLGVDRDGFSRHVFRGGNAFMLRLLNRFRDELGVEAPTSALAETARRTTDHLETASANLSIESAEARAGRLAATISVENLAGHKLPTAYPSRRAWLHVTVLDAEGRVLLESGRLRDDGSIEGNDNDADPDRFEPHWDRVRSSQQVQIYEAIMVDPDERVTTGLLAAIRFVKDNRVLPRGFDKESAPDDIAVHGAALEDGDFVGAFDEVDYVVELAGAEGPFEIRAELLYQSIAFRWARNLQQQEASEIERFVRYYDAMAPESATVLARASLRVE